MNKEVLVNLNSFSEATMKFGQFRSFSMKKTGSNTITWTIRVVSIDLFSFNIFLLITVANRNISRLKSNEFKI